MIRALIIDDEPSACEVLTTLLRDYCPNVEVVGAVTNVDDAILKIGECKPKLLLLDINMPNKDGFSLLENYPEAEFVVIFVTAYNQYVLSALRTGAIDYLLKPIDLSDLLKAIHRAENRIAQMQFEQISPIKHVLENAPKAQTIAIANTKGFEFILLQDIIRIEADASYSKFILKNGKPILASKSIGDVELQLPETMFCRIHHSHIINLSEVRQYVKGRGGYVILSDQSKIDVAVRKKDEFLTKIFSS